MTIQPITNHPPRRLNVTASQMEARDIPELIRGGDAYEEGNKGRAATMPPVESVAWIARLRLAATTPDFAAKM